eukprot:765488-Hanusia_phi.AAC.1
MVGQHLLIEYRCLFLFFCQLPAPGVPGGVVDGASWAQPPTYGSTVTPGPPGQCRAGRQRPRTPSAAAAVPSSGDSTRLRLSSLAKSWPLSGSWGSLHAKFYGGVGTVSQKGPFHPFITHLQYPCLSKKEMTHPTYPGTPSTLFPSLPYPMDPDPLHSSVI